MKTVLLKSMKWGVDGKRENYSEPIKMGVMSLKDGDFLCDNLLGPMGGFSGKSIGQGIWQSIRNPQHFMYEKSVEEENENKN